MELSQRVHYAIQQANIACISVCVDPANVAANPQWFLVSHGGHTVRIDLVSDTPANRTAAEAAIVAIDIRPRRPRQLAAIADDLDALPQFDTPAKFRRQMLLFLAREIRGREPSERDDGLSVDGTEVVP